MSHWLVLGIVLPLTACTVPLTDDRVSLAPEVYTKPEIDAINATAQCRALARTMVQISRCDVGR